MSARPVLTRGDGCAVAHVLGGERRALEGLFGRHYLGTPGGAGYAYAVVSPHGEVLGGALVGPAPSMAAERALVGAPYRVWCIKRLWLADGAPVPESQLLRAALRDVAELRGETILAVAYADPAARDERDGRPLLGWVYYAGGMLLAGETTHTRYGVVDGEGLGRSARQGPVTLSPANIGRLRPGWRMARLPPARVWLAVVVPSKLRVDGEWRSVSPRRRKRERRAAWAAVHPGRRLAAKRWVSAKGWTRLTRAGQRPIAERDREGRERPVLVRGHDRLQPAWWRGGQLTGGAAPVWPPVLVQGAWLGEGDVAGERTAGRCYLPRLLAASGADACGDVARPSPTGSIRCSGLASRGGGPSDLPPYNAMGRSDARR